MRREQRKSLTPGGRIRRLAMLAAAVLAVSLAACGQGENSDDPDGNLALFRERFAEARSVAAHYTVRFTGEGESLNDPDSGRSFFRCTHYSTAQELRSATEAVFTDAYAAGFYTLLSSDAFLERDGGLYLCPDKLYDQSPWMAGDAISQDGQTVAVWLWDTLTVTAAEENTISYSMEWYHTYPGDPIPGVFTLVREEDVWRFSVCFYESSMPYPGDVPIPDTELSDLLAAQFQPSRAGDRWELLFSYPGDGCTLGVLRYASDVGGESTDNLIFGVFGNAARQPVQPAVTIRGDQTACDLWREEDASAPLYLPYTALTAGQGAEACSAGLLSFDGRTLKAVTELPAAAKSEGLTLPEGAEHMLDPAQSGSFWETHKAVLSGALFEIFSRNPDWSAARPDGAVQWVYQGVVPLSAARPPVPILMAVRRYYEELLYAAGAYPMSSSDYPIVSCELQSDMVDEDYPDAIAYSAALYDGAGGFLERILLFDENDMLLGARSNLDYSLRVQGSRYRLGSEKIGLFGVPSATNRTGLSDGTVLYSEWFGADFSTGCDYIYDPDTGTYRLCNLVTARTDAATNRGRGAAVHVGGTLAELIDAYPELDTDFTPQTYCLTMYEPILGGGGCRIEFYFTPNGGLPEPREATLARTITRIAISVPSW